MTIAGLIFMGVIMLTGKEGVDFMFYEKFEELFKRIGMPSPYRNLDRTLISLIREG